MAIDLGAGTGAVDLLLLLPSGGDMSLLGAGLVGLFLANRALAPVRLARKNEQCFIADAAHELRTPLTLRPNPQEGMISAKLL